MVFCRSVESTGLDTQPAGGRARRWSIPRYSNGVHIEMNKGRSKRDGRSMILLLVCLALAFLFSAPMVAHAEKKMGDSKSQKKMEKAELPLRWKFWLEEEVYPLISTEQRKAFLQLETEAQRKAFVERIWNLWSRQSGYESV